LIAKVSCVISETLDVISALIPVCVGLPFLARPNVIAAIGMPASNMTLELFASLEAFPIVALAVTESNERRKFNIIAFY
jgi:hypothetical protein